jgi:hypothetical protein
MNENKGLFASICGFFKGLFSSEPVAESKPKTAPANDGLTSVERYIRNKTENGEQLTGVEKYIRNKTTNSKPLTGVEQYVRNQSQAKPMTGVERYIQNKG